MSLCPRANTYAQLLASFPGNVLEGGSGSITVQPFVAINPPGIVTQPRPHQLFAGRTAQFTVGASGVPPLSYTWRKNGANLVDGANISGSTSATLVIGNVTAADAGTYNVVVSNGGGSVTSSGAALTLVALSGDAYETALLAANPYAIYRLNETASPATGPTAFDYVGGFTGTYGSGAQRSANGLTLTWPAGALLEADGPNGPWRATGAASPYTAPVNGQQKFFRVQLP